MPNSQKRKEALKTAALSPMIYKALWDKFGSCGQSGRRGFEVISDARPI